MPDRWDQDEQRRMEAAMERPAKPAPGVLPLEGLLSELLAGEGVELDDVTGRSESAPARISMAEQFTPLAMAGNGPGRETAELAQTLELNEERMGAPHEFNDLLALDGGMRSEPGAEPVEKPEPAVERSEEAPVAAYGGGVFQMPPVEAAAFVEEQDAAMAEAGAVEPDVTATEPPVEAALDAAVEAAIEAARQAEAGSEALESVESVPQEMEPLEMVAEAVAELVAEETVEAVSEPSETAPEEAEVFAAEAAVAREAQAEELAESTESLAIPGLWLELVNEAEPSAAEAIEAEPELTLSSEAPAPEAAVELGEEMAAVPALEPEAEVAADEFRLDEIELEPIGVVAEVSAADTEWRPKSLGDWFDAPREESEPEAEPLEIEVEAAAEPVLVAEFAVEESVEPAPAETAEVAEAAGEAEQVYPQRLVCDLTALVASIDEEIASAPEIPLEVVQEPETAYERFIVFRLGGISYGVHMKLVREVEKLGPVTQVPGSPRLMLGLINLRGEILPLVDPKQLLGSDAAAWPPAGYIVVVQPEANETPVALLVDELGGVALVEPSNVETNVDGLDEPVARHALGLIEHRGRFVLLLDHRDLLSVPALMAAAEA